MDGPAAKKARHHESKRKRAPPTNMNDAHYTIKRFFGQGGIHIGFVDQMPLLASQAPHRVINPDWRAGMWISDNRGKPAFATRFADVPQVFSGRQVKPEDACFTIKSYLRSGQTNVSKRTNKIALLSHVAMHDVIKEDWQVGKWIDDNRHNADVKEMFKDELQAYPNEFPPSWHA